MRLVVKCTIGVAKSGHVVDAAILPVCDLLAAPLLGVGTGARAAVGVAVGEAAVVASELDAVGRLVPPKLGALESLRSAAILNPVDEVVDDVVLGVRCGFVLTEHPGAGAGNTANAAVGHAGNAEVAKEVVHLAVVDAHLVGDLQVVALRVGAGSERVSHAMVHDHLATNGTEAAEVAVEGGRVALLGVEAEGSAVVGLANGGDIEAGVVVDTAAVVVTSDTLNAAGKLTKSEGIDLRAREKGWVEELAVGVEQRGENCLDSVDLRVAQARGVVVDVAIQGAGVEVADGRVLDDAVGNTVESLVALLLDLRLDKDPLVLGEESSVARLASKLDETGAPGLQVLKVGRGSTGDDAIEVARVVLGGVKTLGTARRATNVVGVGGGGSVVLANDLLSDLNRCVTRAISPVDDLLVTVQHPRAIERRAVVAGVVTNGGETHAGNVFHVNVVNATVETAIVGAHRAAIVVVAIGKPDLHVGGRYTAGLDVHGDLADVDLWSEGVTALSIGLAIGSVGGAASGERNTLEAVDCPVAGGEVIAESRAVTHGCDNRKWLGGWSWGRGWDLEEGWQCCDDRKDPNERLKLVSGLLLWQTRVRSQPVGDG